MTRLPYKIPQSGLKKKIQKSTFSQFWTLDVQIKAPAGFISGEIRPLTFRCVLAVSSCDFFFLHKWGGGALWCLFLYLVRTQALSD